MTTKKGRYIMFLSDRFYVSDIPNEMNLPDYTPQLLLIDLSARLRSYYYQSGLRRSNPAIFSFSYPLDPLHLPSNPEISCCNDFHNLYSRVTFSRSTRLRIGQFFLFLLTFTMHKVTRIVSASGFLNQITTVRCNHTPV